MAKEIPDLVALERTGTGKGAARQARRDGMVPGIVFGGDLDPLPINLDFNKLLTKLRAGRFKATLFNLKVEGQEDVRVICRDVQRDIVKDLPTHFDLMRLRRNTKINLFIPVEFVGEEEAPGIRRGGRNVVIKALADRVTQGVDRLVVGLDHSHTTHHAHGDFFFGHELSSPLRRPSDRKFCGAEIYFAI